MIVKEVYFENINVPIVINYTQGTNDIPIRFKFMDIKLSTSQRVFLYASKVSGNKIYNEAEEVNINEGYVDFAVTTQMSAEAGRNVMQLRITEHEKVVNSFPILFDVTSGVYDEDAILSSNEYKALDQALDNAREWENAAEASAIEAKKYSDNAGVCATNARISELNAKTYETNAKTSEANAKTSEANAKVSETNAKVSETNASTSASAASTSATNAKVSETNASSSASLASTSASNAVTSETNASASASAASASSASAKEYADNAYASANNAAQSEEAALSHASTATEGAESANASKNSAKTSEDNARAHALMSESYAVGTGGIREGEATDNASYYYQRSKEIYENFQSSGTVTGVKGNAEETFRTGNVNITPENIGLGNVPNVTTNNQTPTYTTATSLSALTSGEKISVAFGKIAKAISSLISHISTTATASVLGHVKVDSALSDTSTNPVQNKAIAAELANYAKTTLVSGGDFNDIITPGFYTMKSASANKPASGSYYGLIVLKSDSGNYVEQIAFKKSSHELYVRYLSGSTWSDWKKVLTEKNISQSTAVTATGTYALDAVEKNASVEGTLANQIDKLNTNFTPFFSDYNKKITDVTEASYTATENCLVICDLITTGAPYEYMSISVNNIKIYIYQNIASQANIQSRTSYLLKTGDVIKISASNYVMYVYGRS